jgi:hypothetical protein
MGEDSDGILNLVVAALPAWAVLVLTAIGVASTLIWYLYAVYRVARAAILPRDDRESSCESGDRDAVIVTIVDSRHR